MRVGNVIDMDAPVSRAATASASFASTVSTGSTGSTGDATERRARLRRGQGDRLRDEVLDAAEALLSELGSEHAVSMRAVAQRVGVSPAALYLHFPTKFSLLDAVCYRGFEHFAETIDAAAAAATDPVEALRRMGRAYIEFGLANPEKYQILMLQGDPERYAARPPEDMPGMDCFAMLVDRVAVAMRSGGLRDGDPFLAAVGLWTALHGFVTASIIMESFPWPPLDTVIDQIVETQLRGLAPSPVPPVPPASTRGRTRGA
jgi:AcrR family transcriptional regulator